MPPAGLSDAERSALSAFLQSPPMGGRAMDVHMIQGLAAALSIGPRLISPALWLRWVWDHEQGMREPAFADIDQFNTVAGSVMALYNDAAMQLGPAADEEGLAYTPLFVGAEPAAVAGFCAGFRRAVALAGDSDWLPLWAEWPQWQAVIESPEPMGEDVLALLAPMRRYWRGRTDRLEPLRASDVLGKLREAFEHFQRPFPSAAVVLAERHRELVAPWLIRVLEDVARDPSVAADAEYVLHHFAMVLLGHWRDTRAYRPLLALARLPYDTVDELFGDLLFETYNRALASVCDGDMTPLREIVEDDARSAWVRMTLVDAWALRVIEGDAPAGPLEDCLLAIGSRTAMRLRQHPEIDDDKLLIGSVADAVADIASERLRATVLGWFADQLIDPKQMDLAWFETEMATPLDRRREDQRSRGRSYLRDPETEIGWWSWYHEEPESDEPRAEPRAGTIVRDAPKVGRNDPCPCGSGRKYKKCHGAT